MKVAFSGSRKISEGEAKFIKKKLASLDQVDEFITGAAFGVDTFVCQEALELFPDAKHTLCIPEAAHNESLVKEAQEKGAKIIHCAAGLFPSEAYMNRNDELVARGDILVAFPAKPETRRSGTWATIRRARAAGKIALVYVLDPND